MIELVVSKHIARILSVIPMFWMVSSQLLPELFLLQMKSWQQSADVKLISQKLIDQPFLFRSITTLIFHPNEDKSSVAFKLAFLGKTCFFLETYTYRESQKYSITLPLIGKIRSSAFYWRYTVPNIMKFIWIYETY